MQNAITVTPEALKHMQENLANCPPGTLGIRLGLRDAGCSGFAYTLDFTKEQKPNDQIFSFNQVNIYIAQEYMAALKGTEIALVQKGVNSVLEFNNPNVIHECGCGESFQIKED